MSNIAEQVDHYAATAAQLKHYIAPQFLHEIVALHAPMVRSSPSGRTTITCSCCDQQDPTWPCRTAQLILDRAAR